MSSHSMSNSKNKEHLIIVNTISTSDKTYWIKLQKNNQYIPYDISYAKKDRLPSQLNPKLENPDDWHVVHKKKKSQKVLNDNSIFYWVVSDHNLCDHSDKSYRLFFTEPDMTQIENNDQNNYMAMDKGNQLRLIHLRLKHKGMKMTPNYFIARNVKQIENALHFVKYCVIKTENNEQKLIELDK